MFEPNFCLRRVDVNVHIFVGNRYKHDHDWESARRQDIPVRFADGVQDDLVANQPAIDEEEHRVPVVLLDVRTRREQVYLHTGAAETLLVLDQLVQQVLSEDLKNAFTKRRGRRSGNDFKARALQQEMNLGERQGVMCTVRCDLAQLIRFRAEKLSARRNIEEQILNGYLCSAGKGLFTLR